MTDAQDGDVINQAEGIKTDFIPVPRFTKWTFDSPEIKKWVESHLEGRVLNACAGENKLRHDGDVVRNDLNEQADADTHYDVAELAAHFDSGSFDTVVFDPPWSLYQSNLRYDGRSVEKTADELNTQIDMGELPFDIRGGREKEQLGHARLAKEGFNYLLRPGGSVIEITFHGTCMPMRLGYEREERIIFDPLGEGKCVIGSVDRKMQKPLITDGGVNQYGDEVNHGEYL